MDKKLEIIKLLDKVTDDSIFDYLIELIRTFLADE